MPNIVPRQDSDRPAEGHLALSLHRAIFSFLRDGNIQHLASHLLNELCHCTAAAGGALLSVTPESEVEILSQNGFAPGLPQGPATEGEEQNLWQAPYLQRQTIALTAPPALLAEGMSNFLGIPLTGRNGLVGVLGLCNLPGMPTPTQIIEIEGLAATAALAIDSASMQIANQQANEQLRQAQKMEALGKLAAGVAHDFNNMLTVINGHGSLLARQLAGTEAGEDAELILLAGQRAADLSRQLLAFSRRQMLEPQFLDVNERIRDLDKMLRRFLPENIRIKLDLAEQPDPILADPGQLEQIIMNLVVNARDAMPDGGSIAISSANQTFDREFVLRNRGALPGRYVGFSVRDDGIGMQPTERARIFEPFFTTKIKGCGTGLGLATVYGIVKQSEGYITVESTPGKGSCFSVYLPRTELTPTHNQTEALQFSAPTGKLLLVEDDPAVLRFMVKSLLEQGCEVISAGDAELAVELFELHKQEIVLLITDMVMPTLSGPLLARKLRLQNPELPVLFVSGYGQVTFENDFLQGENGSFLAKPFTPEGLLSKVGATLCSLPETAVNG